MGSEIRVVFDSVSHTTRTGKTTRYRDLHHCSLTDHWQTPSPPSHPIRPTLHTYTWTIQELKLLNLVAVAILELLCQQPPSVVYNTNTVASNLLSHETPECRELKEILGENAGWPEIRKYTHISVCQLCVAVPSLVRHREFSSPYNLNSLGRSHSPVFRSLTTKSRNRLVDDALDTLATLASLVCPWRQRGKVSERERQHSRSCFFATFKHRFV